MMRLFGICAAVIAVVTGLALTVVGSEWGMALLAGGGVALIAFILSGQPPQELRTPRPEQPQPDAFDFFWTDGYALGERPWTHNLYTPAPRPRCEELN